MTDTAERTLFGNKHTDRCSNIDCPCYQEGNEVRAYNHWTMLQWFARAAPQLLRDALAEVDQRADLFTIEVFAGANGGPQTVPHDPDHANGCGKHRARGEACHCTICGVEWPCPARREQRQVIKDVVSLLRASLFVRMPRADDPTSGMRWTSSIGWSVFVAYGVKAAWGVIEEPNGGVWSNTADLSIAWLEEKLP